jgi:hypothetical protein
MALTGFDIWRLEGITSMPTHFAPEGTSVTYVKGAVLIQTSGYTAEAGANPTNVIGVAAHAGKNLTTHPRGFYTPPDDSVIFVGSLDTGAGEGTGTVAAADLGAEYGITKTGLTTSGQTGRWYVDQNKTGADARVRVVELIDAVGTVQGRCGFKFLTAAKAIA